MRINNVEFLLNIRVSNSSIWKWRQGQASCSMRWRCVLDHLSRRRRLFWDFKLPLSTWDTERNVSTCHKSYLLEASVVVNVLIWPSKVRYVQYRYLFRRHLVHCLCHSYPLGHFWIVAYHEKLIDESCNTIYRCKTWRELLTQILKAVDVWL